MPVVGERLQVMGLDRLGQLERVAWRIRRTSPDSPATLESIVESDAEFSEGAPYYLVPAMRAMGLPDPPWLKQTNAPHATVDGGSRN